MNDFSFNPILGLNDHNTGSVDDPVDPRGDIQKFLDQIKTYFNGTVKNEITAKISQSTIDDITYLNMRGVRYNG